LGLPATITIEVVPFRAYAPIPAFLPIFKCILQVAICVSVQHRLRFCLDCVKMAIFQFYLQSEKQRKVGWVGDDSHVAFGKKFPGKKGSDTVCCHDATSISFFAKVRDEVFVHFHAVAVKMSQ
jgi:hypothetical protein